MDLTNSTPESGNTATLETTPVETTGTVPVESEANGVAPSNEETFTSVDPKTLPPALKASYDNMLKDYKAKTQKLSETIKTESQKAAEAYRQKSELYDQIAAQEEFVRQWNEYVEKSQSKPGVDPKVSQLEQKFQEINQKLQLTELSQIRDAFADAVDEKTGQKLRPDFDELNSLSIGQGKDGEYSLLRACVELAPGGTPQERLEFGYKTAKAAYSQIFEAGKKAGMGRVQQKLQSGTNAPSSSNGEILSITDKKPKNAHEAFQLAKKGIVVSRD